MDDEISTRTWALTSAVPTSETNNRAKLEVNIDHAENVQTAQGSLIQQTINAPNTSEIAELLSQLRELINEADTPEDTRADLLEEAEDVSEELSGEANASRVRRILSRLTRISESAGLTAVSEAVKQIVKQLLG